ncbi:L domain-like protein [Piromyces finnis]|uniref:L domain-like protein n=1 Tax=Piromyces finnis TaxID=1754191 RepID=A0A1Y1VKG9_9FUNG|nr:L domain-like protein [Piromyces finnis]|eukprot:ORX58535.1 L domain-like protein [Piromyces finnis]
MKHLFWSLALFFCFNHSIAIVRATNKLTRDCEILKGIYDSYKIKNFESNCCDMENVDCESINSETRMTRLDLSYTNISEIPKNIVNLDELKKINFSGNNLNGEIPSFFSQLPHLEELNLSKNKFYGQIPKSFLDIKNLALLDISDNRLFGIIPSDFCDMETLKIIKYHNNMNSVYPSTCIREKFGL